MTYNEKKSLYESIMKDVAKTVKHYLNESDIKPMSINSEIASICGFIYSFYITNDALRRRNFDKNYAINANPSQNLIETELMRRYVAALISFNQDIPNSLDDVKNIGIFKNYVKAYLEKSGDDEAEFIEELKRTYSLAKIAFDKVRNW